MEQYKKIRITDLMIRAEEKIIQKIQKEIQDTANEEELYYYVFYVVNTYYKNFEFFNKKVESAYSTNSLNNHIKTSLNDVENNLILKNRTERYKGYKMREWLQIKNGDEDRSTSMARFFGFGSENIYGDKYLHMFRLTALHSESIPIISESAKTVLNALKEALENKRIDNKESSLIEKIKSLFK